MEQTKHKLEWLVWGAMGCTIVAIAVAFVLDARPRGPKLPVLFETLPAFVLTNQSGQIISNASLQGSVWVADVIFTRCIPSF